MIEFDPTRLDLAREFRARPFGVLGDRLEDAEWAVLVAHGQTDGA